MHKVGQGIAQELHQGEVRMVSVLECLDRSQVLFADRQHMQGYLDLSVVEWDSKRQILRGTCKLTAYEPYRISLALDGFLHKEVTVNQSDVTARLQARDAEVVDVTLNSPANTTAKWEYTLEFRQ